VFSQNTLVKSLLKSDSKFYQRNRMVSDWWHYLMEHIGRNATNYFLYQWGGTSEPPGGLVVGEASHTSFCLPMGSLRRRTPVAAKMALVIAGTMGEVPTSPAPVGAASLWTMVTLISGVSLMRAMR